jgi:hypothetical protein
LGPPWAAVEGHHQRPQQQFSNSDRAVGLGSLDCDEGGGGPTHLPPCQLPELDQTWNDAADDRTEVGSDGGTWGAGALC